MAGNDKKVDLAAMIESAVKEAEANTGEAVEATVKVADSETLKTSAKSGC